MVSAATRKISSSGIQLEERADIGQAAGEETRFDPEKGKTA
jgi:hypothetical protein